MGQDGVDFWTMLDEEKNAPKSSARISINPMQASDISNSSGNSLPIRRLSKNLNMSGDV
jgi:hypothetical protein